MDNVERRALLLMIDTARHHLKVLTSLAASNDQAMAARLSNTINSELSNMEMLLNNEDTNVSL